MDVYSHDIKVSHEHLDINNHVNNLVYLQWALEVSKQHWLQNASEELAQSYYWVVRSHHVEYKKQSFLDDHLTVETFVSAIAGPFSERKVRILKESDVIAEVNSKWCLIERTTQKLKRIPKEIEILFN